MSNRVGVTVAVWIVAFSVTLSFALSHSTVRAESALSLLSGFDAERLAAIFGDDNEQPNIGELAKLLYRIEKLDATALESRVAGVNDTSVISLGDAMSVGGQVRNIKRLSVPEALVDLLEFKQYFRVDIDTTEGLASSQSIYVMSVPATIAAGDAVSATGVVVGIRNERNVSEIAALAASNLRWTPAKSLNVGLKLLADEGVDMAGVTKLAERNRQPLQNADSDIFYTMMAAGAAIANQDAPAPEPIRPATLLQEPQSWIGQWIRMEADTVRISRIAVTQSKRQQQLGATEYFQIDAIGDLGNVVIELQRPEGAPVRFENRFPISLVMARLPKFLQDHMQDDRGEASGVKLVSTRVEVDGFFFRLWSYQTDRMSRGGEGEQIGPLVIAASIRDLEIPGSDPIGVSKIGYIAAIAVLIGLALAWLWNRSNAREDAMAHQSRDRHPGEDVGWLKDQSGSDSGSSS